ncbi:GlxA family transcriptional regulator [Granulosicoccus sp.]|nr:GlxA family transcriptional regulator [Granulosicoccus sp.]
MSAPESSIDFSRYGVNPDATARQIGFFLPDTFAILPFISALEPLRVANRIAGKALYNWQLLGTGNEYAFANNAMPFALDGSVLEVGKLDRLIVCGTHEPHLYNEAKVFKAFRQWFRSGTQLGSLDTGTHLLASADLIKNRRCTIHWEKLPGFREAFPGISVSSALFELDDDLFTCAGGAAALDMMLALITQDHNKTLAAQVAEIFISPGTRQATDPQRRSIVERSGIHHPGLVTCIELMESNVEQPLSTSELADMIHVSSRQLERLFKAYMHTTPTLYYQQVRLQAGFELLRQTTMSVLEVSAVTGFTSSDYFSRRFRARYGMSPSQARKQDLNS